MMRHQTPAVVAAARPRCRASQPMPPMASECLHCRRLQLRTTQQAASLRRSGRLQLWRAWARRSVSQLQEG